MYTNSRSSEVKTKTVTTSKSTTNTFLGIASLSAGAVHGFYDAQGMPLPKENMEFALTWGPTIFRGAYSGAKGGIFGLVSGGAAGVASSGYYPSGLEVAVKGTAGAAAGTVAGAAVGATVGAVAGGFQTLTGYCLGYAAGYILK